MSEVATAPEPKTRTMADVQNEFQSLCAKAGHIQYQIHVLTKDLDQVNTQVEDLNFEAAAISRAEKEAKAKEAANEQTKKENN